jgi:hypothetical protein
MTRGIGPERVIDAVGVDAERGPGADDESFDREVADLAPSRAPEFDRREAGWLKVELVPAAARASRPA